MVNMATRIRPVLFVLLLAAAAILASIRLFGGDEAAVTDVPALAGRWEVEATGESGDPIGRTPPGSGDVFRLRLGREGRYSIAVRSTAGTLVTTECGRWQSLEGRWQMRATAGGDVGDATPLLLEQPALRLGHVERPPTPEEPDEAVVVVRAARRGAGTERWRFRRARGSEAAPVDAAGSGHGSAPASAAGMRDCGPIDAP